MPVSYGQITTIVNARLDANPGNDRYLPEQDLIPAYNSAASRLQYGIGWALANRKGTEEILRDFAHIAIYQTDAFGSILIDDPAMPWTVANVAAIYVDPDLQVTGTVNPLPDNQSAYRGDLAWAGAGKPTHRVTLEQAPIIKTNASMRGNEVLASNPDRVTFAYYLQSGRAWIIPKSVMGRRIVAMAQIKKFVPMTTVNDSFDFPDYVAEFLATWALDFIAVKQDTQGLGVGAFAQKDIAQLFGWSTN